MSLETIGQICRCTPAINVLGQAGQVIRALAYNRQAAEAMLDERITRHEFNALGHLVSSVDPRFFGSETHNFINSHSLNGQTLCTMSADAGTTHTLYDVAGRPVWSHDARGTEQNFTYDTLGRLIKREETLSGEDTRVAEQFIYGERLSSELELANYNLRGQLAKHYDTAGVVDVSTQGYALVGGNFQQGRKLLPTDTQSDWQGDYESNHVTWEDALEEYSYTTQASFDATAQTLTQTDAANHQQRYEYDIAGRLKASWVTLNGTIEQPILDSITYSAANQKLREEAANGVVTEYGYEAETQRLLSMTTSRPTQAKTVDILQQLNYEYDPVGNIVSLQNGAEAVTFFRNQRTDANQYYQYDALYQLIQVNGRENATISQNPTDNPDALIPPLDANQFTPYTRNYTYDRCGNLTQLQHIGETVSYNREIVIANSSNHGMLKTNGQTPDTVDEYFDECGNQIQLDTGQLLAWNGLNQLSQVNTVVRSQSSDDTECYQYAGDGIRIRKLQRSQTARTTRQQEVIYLPALELHKTSNGAVVDSEMEVITIGQAGRYQVRVLNWKTGKPAEINNQQIRYSMDDMIGSSLLELDKDANILTKEEYYPYGGTAVRAAKSAIEAKYKTVRYSGKERDVSGLCYYGYRYYQPWLGRWLNVDPSGTEDGLNLYQMVSSNPVSFFDNNGLTGCRAYTHYHELNTFLEELDDLYAHLRSFHRTPREHILSTAGHNVTKRFTLLMADAALSVFTSLTVAAPVAAAAGPIAGPFLGGVAQTTVQDFLAVGADALISLFMKTHNLTPTGENELKRIKNATQHGVEAFKRKLKDSYSYDAVYDNMTTFLTNYLTGVAASAVLPPGAAQVIGYVNTPMNREPYQAAQALRHAFNQSEQEITQRLYTNLAEIRQVISATQEHLIEDFDFETRHTHGHHIHPILSRRHTAMIRPRTEYHHHHERARGRFFHTIDRDKINRLMTRLDRRMADLTLYPINVHSSHPRSHRR
ncbi:RHS repeat-associated core domain-containing protein [Zooshikella sp. RANM57]|uniref:RHS repeat-associated core domain-containing protein n=1 Tax=Zooshikella sp. RANM57 TaxID=3425863 RepID=UPI003D6E63EC